MKKALEEEGVVFGIEAAGIEEVLQAFRSEESGNFQILVAQGAAAEKETSPKFVLDIEEAALVGKGAVVAHLEGGAQAKAGRTVYGEEISPPSSRSRTVSAGENVEFSKANQTFIALIPGYPEYDERSISVAPLFSVSSDEMTAFAHVRPLAPDASPPTEDVFRRMLADAGVVFGATEQSYENVVEAMKSDANTDDPVIVAVGKPPTAGTEARIEWLKGSEPSAGLERENGNIDFHQRQVLQEVRSGDLLAVKTPIQPGVDGVTVAGNAVEPDEVADCGVVAGENVAISAKGLHFKATIDGIVVRGGNLVRVVEVLEVEGNVDFSTGDLDSPKAVVIQGAVSSTFAVHARGPITVMDCVEDSIVESTDSVVVALGIIHRTLGSLKAGACVEAKYTQNAQVHAGDSILLRDSALHSFLAAKNEVKLLEGKGTAIGGHLIAGAKVELKVAGSKMNAHTILQVGMNYDKMEVLYKRLRSILTKMKKIISAEGMHFLDYVNGDAKPPDAQHIRQCLKEWRKCEKEKEVLLEERSRVLAATFKSGSQKPSIIVHEIVHAGVEVIIGAARKKIQESIGGGHFSLDPETNEVEMASTG